MAWPVFLPPDDRPAERCQGKDEVFQAVEAALLLGGELGGVAHGAVSKGQGSGRRGINIRNYPYI